MKILVSVLLLKILAVMAWFFMMPVSPFTSIPNSILNVGSQYLVSKKGENYTSQPLLYFKTSDTDIIKNINANKLELDGDLLVITDMDVDMVAHYYHFMEHLLGIWSFLTYKNTANVKMIVVSLQNNDHKHTWRGLNNVTSELLANIFPNAKTYLAVDLPPDLNICAKNVLISNRFRVLGSSFMNGAISAYYHPEKIRELRDVVFKKIGVIVAKPTDHLRITYIKRISKKRVMESKLEQQLIDSIAQETGHPVNVVDFSQMSFFEQLQTVANTDLLIGVHGNGLTHLIFLPDAATVLEYHPGKRSAYFRTMAQIRGLQYYGNYHTDWFLKYNKSLRNDIQDTNVTEIDLPGTLALIRTLNNKYKRSAR